MALIRRTEKEASPAPNRVWDPFQIMDQLMQWDPFADFGLRASMLGSEGFAPQLEIRENRDGYVFSLDAPGVSEDALELSLAGNTLTIQGHREEEQREEGERVHVIGRRYGAFSRSFSLPEGVDSDKIEAQLRHGVLKVTVPKRPEHKPRRVWLTKLLGSRSEESAAA